MPELTQPPELTLTGIELTNAQLAEIWGADSEEDAVALLARIVKLPDAADEPRTAAWVDLMHQTLVFAKHVPLSGTKTLAFFALVNDTLHAAASAGSSKEAAFDDFAERMMATAKGMAADERFTLAETQQLTSHVRDVLLAHIQLITYVLTRPQKIRESRAEYFVCRPASLPPLEDGKTPEEIEAEAAAAAEQAAAEAAAAPR